MDISSMLEVQVNELKQADSKENVTPEDYGPSTTKGRSPISQEEYNFYKLMFGNDLASVRFRRLHCTACDVHIGSAPSQAHNMHEHPILRILLCLKCREFYGDGDFEQGDDATDMFCRWCANGGNLYCCSYCSNTFCSKCIRRNFDPLVRKKIEADEKWKCFVCDPMDLYSARGVCWALLQHVQTVKRILQKDRTMSPQEIEEKMNLDESQCCPRKRKRKRRRADSSSDDDETYIPTAEPVFLVQKRKQKRCSESPVVQRKNIANGTAAYNNQTSVRSSASSQNAKSQNPPSKAALQQSIPKINLDPKYVVATGFKSVNTLPSKLNSSVTCTPLFKSTVINAISTRSLLINPMNTSDEIAAAPTMQSGSIQAPPQTSLRPMVAIPNNHVSLLKRTQVFVRNQAQAIQNRIVPNVIEIDSDSDEPAASNSVKKTRPVEESTASEVATVVVPVALLSTEDRLQKNVQNDQPLEEIEPTKYTEKKFNDVAEVYKQSINEIMNNLKSRLSRLSDSGKVKDSKEDELQDRFRKTKDFHHEIRTAIKNLATINDMAVRDYLSLQRTKIREDNVPPVTPVSKISVRKDIKLPLDMVCVNESAEESENDSDAEVNVVNPSSLVLSSNVVEGIRFGTREKSVNRAVGDHSVLTEDKGVQVYDDWPSDYEKRIGYSLLAKKKAVDTETELQQPAEADKYFGKYEEQYIYYLQRIEDSGIDIEDADALNVLEEDLREIRTENSDLIETGQKNEDKTEISHTKDSEISKQSDSDILPEEQSSNTNQSILDNVGETSSESVPKSVDEATEVVSKLTDKLETNERIIDNSKVIAKSASVIKVEMEKSNVALSGESEDECTIID